MPLYEYSCFTCGKTFERVFPFSGKRAKVVCPKGHQNIRRVYSPPTIAFKGSGWYSTDNKGPKTSHRSLPE